MLKELQGLPVTKAVIYRNVDKKAWEQIAVALAKSKDPEDVRLAMEAVRYLSEVAPGGQEAARLAARSAQQQEDERFKGVRAAPVAKPDRAR